MKQIITLVIALLLTTGLLAQAPNPFPKTISVNGSADMEIIPDEIYVVVTLKEYEKKGTGKIELEKIKTDFLATCKNAGLPDSAITIASYEGANPRSWLSKRKSKDELYGSIAYQIKFSNSRKIDELVNKLDDDATQSFDVVRVSHSKIQEYRKQVKIMAIKAAKEKATYLTEAVGETLGVAVTISENGPDNIQSLGINNTRGFFENVSYKPSISYKSEDAGIDFKKIKITMDINVVFALK
ncbi:hypothetical protein A3860_16535 [Niastella vici]|uniref:SIMPL domain-containing protein n=1 Tax=Niastella vici TaxID=1703345 RepID=A0A1V9G3Q1_9BACT|nr:SIMPL domain-containing protein [Niastella vici]OQP65275.1 hypothetical protein A3860_16535 [Niastella vici]